MNEYVSTGPITCALKINEPPSKIIFKFLDKKLVEITPEGIVFNREEFPHFLADDFAREFLHVLEHVTRVKFYKIGEKIE